LEFTNGTLESYELFRVFFSELVQLFPKPSVPNIKANGQKGRGEQYQRIETTQEVEKGHGHSSDIPLG